MLLWHVYLVTVLAYSELKVVSFIHSFKSNKVLTWSNGSSFLNAYVEFSEQNDVFVETMMQLVSQLKFRKLRGTKPSKIFIIFFTEIENRVRQWNLNNWKSSWLSFSVCFPVLTAVLQFPTIRLFTKKSWLYDTQLTDSRSLPSYQISRFENIIIL